MSKRFRLFVAVLLIPVAVTLSVGQSASQTDVVLRIEQGAVPVAKIRGTTAHQKHLSFLRSIAGVAALETRISNLKLQNAAGEPVSFRYLTPGDLVANSDFSKFEYNIDLGPMKERGAAAHVSWFAGDRGILMLRDMLPRMTRTEPVRVTFDSGMPMYSNEFMSKSKTLVHDSIDDVVYYIGTGWRVQKVRRSTASPLLNLNGEWQFTDDDAFNFVADIAFAYETLFGIARKPEVQVAIAKFPIQTGPGHWEAETIGRNVTIISSDMPFKTQSIQRLHEQLRHELFHLWIPNDVNLTGNYDWFYEGFALYESLRLAVSMNRIRFADFLDTLSRAHTIDSAQMQRPSLINASANRFGGNNTQVYARGMLVAFLVDLAMLEKSRGKRSVENVLRELYAKHRKPSPAIDGNKAVIELLEANVGSGDIVKKYVVGTDKIDWANEIAKAGISDSDAGPLTTLKVNEELSGRQKTLLDKLGYNNWRKLSPISR